MTLMRKYLVKSGVLNFEGKKYTIYNNFYFQDDLYDFGEIVYDASTKLLTRNFKIDCEVADSKLYITKISCWGHEKNLDKFSKKKSALIVKLISNEITPKENRLMLSDYEKECISDYNIESLFNPKLKVFAYWFSGKIICRYIEQKIIENGLEKVKGHLRQDLTIEVSEGVVTSLKKSDLEDYSDFQTFGSALPKGDDFNWADSIHTPYLRFMGKPKKTGFYALTNRKGSVFNSFVYNFDSIEDFKKFLPLLFFPLKTNLSSFDDFCETDASKEFPEAYAAYLDARNETWQNEDDCTHFIDRLAKSDVVSLGCTKVRIFGKVADLLQVSAEEFEKCKEFDRVELITQANAKQAILNRYWEKYKRHPSENEDQFLDFLGGLRWFYF